MPYTTLFVLQKRIDKTDLMSFDEMRERLANRDAIRERQAQEEQAEEEREQQQQQLMAAAAQQQAAAALQAQQQQQQSQQDAAPASATAAASSSSSNEAVTAAAADTSSEVARKIRERFMKDVSKVIVKVLTPFRKETGQIGTNEDFKHLAKKVSAVTAQQKGIK